MTITDQSTGMMTAAPRELILADDATTSTADHSARLWLWQWPALGTDERQALIAALPWEQPQIQLFGRRQPIPRLQCWCADPGIYYRYSGRTATHHPWPTTLLALRELTERLSGRRFNGALINLYRNGADSMGWHADDEAELGAAPWVASWSFGASRDFQLRRKGSQRCSHTLRLEDNQLLLMSPQVQQYWQHALPRRRRQQGSRLNLTFRLIMSPETQDK